MPSQSRLPAAERAHLASQRIAASGIEMFVAAALCVGLGSLPAGAADCRCQLTYGRNDVALRDPATPSDRSSFAGLWLGITSGAAISVAASQGMAVEVVTYVGSPGDIAMMNLCRKNINVGSLSFDRNGQATRLSLRPGYFEGASTSVGDFVRNLFRLYGVKQETAADDLCFQDVTCFRGRTRFGEKLLIMKIGDHVELLINQPRENLQ